MSSDTSLPRRDPAAGGRHALARPGQSRAARTALLLALAALTIIAALIAVTLGSFQASPDAVFDAVLHFDGSREHIVIRDVRLPRVLAALLVGSSLAVAGAIMQAMTGNPLASPGLLGINGGAAFVVVLAVALLDAKSEETYIWFAFAGAALAGSAVYLIGSAGGRGGTHVRLALAGAVLSTFLGALTASFLIFDQATLEVVRLWSVGSLANRQMSSVLAVCPYILAGLAAALVFSREIMTLSLGETIAQSVGQSLAVWRAVAALIVVLLAGGAVALAGPVGFVGLVVPHIGRFVVGTDYRWIIPFCAVGGALLVVLADGLLRWVLPVGDIPVGVTMALVGTPLFIHLARRLGAFR
ncbi:FecCD family ABC transporter permease [Terrihabitans sp. B22-R8]|uniref:FecCD family ABC transporter permease n=1 Tax=Terrihabitans sp. B22-R8 TaxID=3425128 RepID=UPI00403CC37D